MLALLACALLTAACTKKDPNQTSASLPSATQTGANTFGAMVNGVVFTPNDYFGNFGKDLNAYYGAPTSGDPRYMEVDAYDYVASPNKGMRIASNMPLQAGQTYSLQASANNLVSIKYLLNELNEYDVITPLTGQLTITKFDQQNRIISGTFYFDAVNSTGDKVSVTDGRFDVKF